MQIKYRITLAYTGIVSVILLLLCAAIYIFSEQNRKIEFQARLKGRALSAARLMHIPEFNIADIRRINQTSPGILSERSICVLDAEDSVIYEDNTPGTKPIIITYDILKAARAAKTYYFTQAKRQGVAIEHSDGQRSYIIIVAAYDNETTEWLEKLKLILLICYIASIFFVVFSGYIFSLRVVKSITRLRQKIDMISSQHFSQRLETGSGKDELEKLAITINDLLDRLQLSFDTQRRFIDNASHELSTPLTAIFSQLEVALLKERTPDEYRKTLISVKDDLKRLNLLTRSLLEIAKASGSQGGTELATVRIDELLMRLPADLRRIGPFYEVKMEFAELPEDEYTFSIYGNEPLLFIAFKNIAHNACKYSSDKTAYVKLDYTENNIIVEISDNGQGIEPHDLENIFQPFYRGGKYNNLPGAGLGLALTYHIIRLHHGTIEAASELGKGSTFTVTLPR